MWVRNLLREWKANIVFTVACMVLLSTMIKGSYGMNWLG